jgi:hypothetical protein
MRASSIHSAAGRLTATIGDAQVYFESADVPMAHAPEAFAGAMLEPAMERRERLQFDDALDPVWLHNAQKIPAIYKKWWDYPADFPIDATAGATGNRAAGIGACFTGGVDSFYTQLRGPNASRITHLVYVHGYDIPIDDMTRMQAFEPSLRAVAAALGRKAIVLCTNLRQHPLFASANWEHAHGGALTAAGHILAGTVGTLVIPSSYTYADSPPWGSHFDTDPLHSSSRVQLVHDDASRHRRAKLRAIAHEPIVRNHLRVCWENKSATGNCSQCEKCVRTMIVLSGVGELQNYTVFDRSRTLPERIDALPFIASHLVYVYRALADDNLPTDVRRAVRRLLDRSAKEPSLRKRIVRKVQRVFGW